MSLIAPDSIVRTSDRQVPVVELGVKLEMYNIDIKTPSYAEFSPMIPENRA